MINPTQERIRQKARVVPESRKEAFLAQINEQLKAGIIAPSLSPWSSPPHIVAKPDGSIRVTIDYKKLNSLTEKDTFPLPNVDSLFKKLAYSNYLQN